MALHPHRHFPRRFPSVPVVVFYSLVLPGKPNSCSKAEGFEGSSPGLMSERLYQGSSFRPNIFNNLRPPGHFAVVALQALVHAIQGSGQPSHKIFTRDKTTDLQPPAPLLYGVLMIRGT